MRADPAPTPVRRPAAGFTLLELMISITILVFLSAIMGQIITGTMRGADAANEQLRAPKMANAIFQQIFKDFRYIYYGGLTGDAGFRGTNDSLGGKDADKVDFITTRRTRTIGADDSGRLTEKDRISPVTEVGYALRHSDTNPGYRELWRREDYFVDDKPAEGGQYSLVYDRVRSLSFRYFPIPEQAQVREGLEEWDASQKKGLPYAILMRLEFDVPGNNPESGREQIEQSEPQVIFRIILLRGAYSVPWTAPGSAPAR